MENPDPSRALACLEPRDDTDWGTNLISKELENYFPEAYDLNGAGRAIVWRTNREKGLIRGALGPESITSWGEELFHN